MIIKVLSANDLGETGSHQAGMLIPKIDEILSFFPPFDGKTKNPSTYISFTDDAGDKWNFRYIYYNNKFFGGTRNEYRLTRMTKFFRTKTLKVGDNLKFYKQDGKFMISHERQSTIQKDYIKLSDSWVTVKLK